MNHQKTCLPVPSDQKITALKHMLESKRDNLKRVLPAHLAPDKMIRIALVAASRTPLLLACSKESIYTAMMDAAGLGLEPFTGLNLSYIIPYKNGKTGQYEAKFIISYKGMLDLARRSGEILSIDTDVVYDRDKWEVEKGLNPKLVHIPCYDGKDRGTPILVYAIAKFRDGGHQFEIMTIPQIEYIRTKSKSPQFGPWVDFWEEMARKTCLKKLLKLCPMSTELARAVAKDNSAERDDPDINVDCIDVESEDSFGGLIDSGPASHHAPDPSKAESLAKRLEDIAQTTTGPTGPASNLKDVF
jgi:recombination protein RecT